MKKEENCLDRENEILLYEPERIDARAVLPPEARMHRQLHLLLEKAGQELKERAPSVSASFDNMLLERLEQAVKHPSSLPLLNDADFLPVVSAGEGVLQKPMFWKISALVLLFLGGSLIPYFLYRSQMPQLPAQTEKTQDAERSAADEQKMAAPGVLDERKEKMEKNGVINRKPYHLKPEMTYGAVRPDAPPPAADMWKEEARDPEMELKSRIEIEQDPLKRIELQRQLLHLYESTGQNEKAADLRLQIK
jgi:hypothetical protein